MQARAGRAPAVQQVLDDDLGLADALPGLAVLGLLVVAREEVVDAPRLVRRVEDEVAAVVVVARARAELELDRGEVTIVVRDLPLDGDRAGVVRGAVSHVDNVAEVWLLHLDVLGVARGAGGRRAGGEDDEPQHRCARSAPGVRGPLLDLSARAASVCCYERAAPKFQAV